MPDPAAEDDPRLPSAPPPPAEVPGHQEDQGARGEPRADGVGHRPAEEGEGHGQEEHREPEELHQERLRVDQGH